MIGDDKDDDEDDNDRYEKAMQKRDALNFCFKYKKKKIKKKREVTCRGKIWRSC